MQQKPKRKVLIDMSLLTESKVHQLYSIYKIKAQRALKKKHYDSCLRYLTVVAHTGYSYYMGYKDDDLEDLLEQLATCLNHCGDKKNRRGNVCVFYDSFSYDNGGLVQQYLGAIISSGFRIHYITQREAVLKNSSAIGNMLRSYRNAEIVLEPPKLSPLQRAQFIYNYIMETEAGSLFIHSTPDAAIANTAFYALPKSIKKYKINLTDHTFWIGTRFIDYSLEFRPYGAKLSFLKRGIAKDKIIHMPFYPIMNHTAFQGFPDKAKGKIILFSGASYYKIFDKDDTFFKLSKAILDACPMVVLLFAGFGDSSVLNDKLERYGLKDRFLLIGHRTDITEVFEHCDIYLNTYPSSGGLMSQYAAQLSKPIVNYVTSGTSLVEEFVCQIRKIDISDYTIESVVERVSRLANDSSYRDTFGREIRSCVLSPAEFNERFAKCMVDEKSMIIHVENEPFVEHINDLPGKLEIDNITKGYQISFVKTMGFLPALFQRPSFVFDALLSIIKSNRVLKVIKNRL